MPSDIQNQSTCDKWWNLTHFGCKGAWRMVIRGMENGSRVAQRQNVLLTLNGPLGGHLIMTYCLEKSFSPSLSLSFIYLFICLFIYLINNINITGIYLFIVLFWMSNFRQLNCYNLSLRCGSAADYCWKQMKTSLEMCLSIAEMNVYLPVL